MSPPTSPLFQIQDIPHAGRGLIALQPLSPSPSPIHTSPSPLAHVIFRPYRKEVCAQCFHYNRGRSLPHRDATTGKVFCTPACQSEWIESEGELGVDAWKALHAFVQKNAKAIITTTVDHPSPDDHNSRPSIPQITLAWSQPLLPTSDPSPLLRRSRKPPPPSSPPRAIDPDILALFLSAILSAHRHPDLYTSSVPSLAMDPTPYTSLQDLNSYTSSCRQLLEILPSGLVAPAAIPLCREIVSAASHNAFGIRAGGEDAEEYLGWGVYPSASYFNHSCAPNVAKRRVRRAWEFVVGAEVRVGEQLCITYLGGDEKDLDVVERRARLAQHWGFVCQCQRCRDEATQA